MSRPLEDREARRRATGDLARSLAVEASAGTGKTSLIVGRVLALIETGTAAIREMAVITFTEKAAAELEERVRGGIEDRLAELARADDAPSNETAARLARARDTLDQASIQTIHAFATSLLRRRPVEAGVDPRFTVTDAAGQRFLFEETWERYVAGQAVGDDAPLARVLAAGTTPKDLRDLAERFVENRDLSVDGSPGRAPAPEGAAAAACALAAWIVDRAAELAPLCRDPQDKLLASFQEAVGFARALAALPEFRARRALLGDPKKIKKKLGRADAWLRNGKELVGRVADEWEARFGAFRAAHDRHVTGEAAFWLRGFLAVYEARKRRDGVLDFQDLLLLARDLLRRPGIAEDLRRSVRFVLVDEFQDTDPLQVEIAALLTGAASGAASPAAGGEDEGAVPAPEPWTALAPIPGALFFVGDPKQSIYRFRRADLDVYDDARDWLEDAAGAGGGSASLAVTANFRSRPGITDFVNATFSRLFTGLGETPRYSRLDPQRRAGGQEAVAFLIPEDREPAARAETPSGRRRDPREKREMEAALIARALRRAVEAGSWPVGRGVPSGADPESETERAAGYGDVALLMRSFTDVGIYEDALQDEGIPCQTATGRRYFLRPEVAWFGALLRAVESPHDEVAVVSALRSPFFGLTDEEILTARLASEGLDPLRPERAGGDAARALAVLGRWHGERHEAPVGVVVRRLLHESSALALLALREGGERSLANLLKIADLARRHESDGGTFRTFVRWLARARSESFEQPDTALVEASRDAVQILTIHAAKGLEFPIVVLPDLARKVASSESFLIDRERGRIAFRLQGRREGPKKASFRSDGYDGMMEHEGPILAAERQRLLYVAATRARDRLVIPLPDPAKRVQEETFLKDLARAGALPAPAALAAAGDGDTITLVNGARARVERIPGRVPPASGAAWLASAPPGTGSTRPAAALSVLEAWQREREELLAGAARAPGFLTASGVAESAAETDDGVAAPAGARAATLSDLPGAGAERLEEARDAARRFGLAVHAVLEAADLEDPSSVAALAREQARACGLPREAGRIEQAARGALALPAVLEARGRRVLREVPVAFVENGVLVEGQIDFVAEREDGSLLVADFKTDGVATLGEARERARVYAPQLALYAHALERASGKPVSETAVLFAAAGHEIRAPFDDDARALARDAIARAAG